MQRIILLVLILSACTQKKDQPLTSSYLNHNDSARYVGMNTCRLCHQNVYDNFIQTGMGQSIGLASRQKSSAEFDHPNLNDPYTKMNYCAYWSADSLQILEYRLSLKDTVHKLNKRVNYIIGSGQHTNSHLHLSNGYLTQMPMTYYTQRGKWDLPPGFENGMNTRFSRKIGLECMTCHNAYPDFELGSENKYKFIPTGIDCERCHGPGSIHVAQRTSGSKVDTTRFIDYSIVNPSKLPVDLQFDICQRCHLQGNAVLKEGRSFLDFKPGQKLSEVMTVFLPKYSGSESDFIMASHADRLKMSSCFVVSEKKAGTHNKLKPYKDAVTCLTCHNPHLSVRNTGKEVFDRACLNCHASSQMKTTHRNEKEFNGQHCYTCHMPVSGSTDIPHVTVHDHYIRKPVTAQKKNEIKRFLGLHAINEPNPSALTRAKAYLQQYEKFTQEVFYLDSATKLLTFVTEGKEKFKATVQLLFFRSGYDKVLEYLSTQDAEKVYSTWLIEKSYDNADAWTAYRIAESFTILHQDKEALKWMEKAILLAPFQLEFRNKLGNLYARLKDYRSAEREFRWMLQENPMQANAYSNLGFLYLIRADFEIAEMYLLKGLNLEPDNENLLLNMANLHLQRGDEKKAIYMLNRVLLLNPDHEGAKLALSRLKNRT